MTDNLEELQKALDNRPQCEQCEVFTSDKTQTSTARAIFCEGLRAVCKCYKDEWFEDFTRKFAAYRAELEKNSKEEENLRLESSSEPYRRFLHLTTSNLEKVFSKIIGDDFYVYGFFKSGEEVVLILHRKEGEKTE